MAPVRAQYASPATYCKASKVKKYKKQLFLHSSVAPSSAYEEKHLIRRKTQNRDKRKEIEKRKRYLLICNQNSKEHVTATV